MKTAGVYRWELRKLAAQKRTYAGLGAAAIYALSRKPKISIQVARIAGSPKFLLLNN